MLPVSNVYVTLSNTCRHDGFHRYEQFSHILGGLVLPKSLYKPKFIDKISLCSLETGEKTAGSERRKKACSILKDSCLESRGGVHNFPRFGLGPQRKVIEATDEVVCKQEGWSSQ